MMSTNTTKKGYSRFVFINDERAQLLKTFVPKYSKVIAHHATHEFGVTRDHAEEDVRTWQGAPSFVDVYGYLNSGDGLECLLVQVDGKKHRPDGCAYHITWSLRPDRYKPVDSNKLIVARNYQPIKSIPISMVYWWEEFQ